MQLLCFLFFNTVSVSSFLGKRKLLQNAGSFGKLDADFRLNLRYISFVLSSTLFFLVTFIFSFVLSFAFNNDAFPKQTICNKDIVIVSLTTVSLYESIVFWLVSEQMCDSVCVCVCMRLCVAVSHELFPCSVCDMNVFL